MGPRLLGAFLSQVHKPLEQASRHRPHRKHQPMLDDERVSHFVSLAKYAVAFYDVALSGNTR
jgi:hypothetical protein